MKDYEYRLAVTQKKVEDLRKEIEDYLNEYPYYADHLPKYLKSIRAFLPLCEDPPRIVGC